VGCGVLRVRLLQGRATFHHNHAHQHNLVLPEVVMEGPSFTVVLEPCLLLVHEGDGHSNHQDNPG
jgi:hypothetical protein